MYGVVVFVCGFFLGALVMALCAMARCNDCEAVNRIIKGGK